jgi:hypothetical protein
MDRSNNGRFRSSPATLRFLAKFRVAEDGCWVWYGSTNQQGYGQFWVVGKLELAHRRAFLWWRGLIPPGTEIDHLCRVRSCVNPSHLHAVSHRENTLCGRTVTATNAAKTHCFHGHPFNLENTGPATHGRRCRICHAEEERARRERIRYAARAVWPAEEEKCTT